MAKKQYAFYPGCSSQLKASAANYLTSVAVDVQDARRQAERDPRLELLQRVRSAIARAASCRGWRSMRATSRRPRRTCRARTIVATCAACWLSARESKDRLDASSELMRETNEALAAAGLHYKGEVEVKHMVEVLIEDFGYEQLARPMVKSLEGVKFAGYVGCQTNRPFGIDGESFENPVYLDKMVEIVGGEAIGDYDQKVTCCGGALAFSEPEKSQKQIRDIVESAYDHGAEMIVTPCPLCQANVEVYQSEINRKQGTKLNMPVLYYSQLLTIAYGGSAKDAGLDGQLIRAPKLEEIAAKRAK